MPWLEAPARANGILRALNDCAVLRYSHFARAALALLGFGSSACGNVATEVRPSPGPARAEFASVTGQLLDEEDEAGPADGAAPPGLPAIHASSAGPFQVGSWYSNPRSERVDDAYALDGVGRFLRAPGTPLSCAPLGLVSYSGTSIRYRGAAVVNPAFRTRLARFEQVVREAALSTYGRAPLRIRHRGAFACRSQRNQPHWLSEHALGNAIDVSGFDFGPSAAADAPTALDVPRTAFRVSIPLHWENERDPISARHAQFLRAVVTGLLARGDVFRGVIGPRYPGHSDHFHFDMAPRNYVRL